MRLLAFAGIVWMSVLIAQQNEFLAFLAAILIASLLFVFRNQLALSLKNVLLLGTLNLAVLTRQFLPTFEITLPSGFESLRKLTRELCQGVSEDAQALVLGITDGDDSQLSFALQDQMRTLSLTHLTAVSGTNCSILIAATFGWLARLGFRNRGRVIGSLIALMLYLGLVGSQPSVFRAAAMATFALLALLTGSRLNPIAVLGASILALLLIDPSMASEYGFALSALATAGLLILAPKMYERLAPRLPKWLALSVSVTASAQLFCLPVLVLLQPEQSSLAVIANILVEPVVVVITLLGIGATVLAVISPTLAQALFWLASLPAQYVVSVAQQLNKLDAPVVELANLSGLMTLVLVLIVLAIQVPKLRKICSASLASLAIIGLALQTTKTITGNFPIPNWFYASCDVGQGDATVIRSENQVAVIDVGREPKLINRCLNRLGIRRIDLLVLTHFDADHVAGLSGALDGRDVSLALISSYQDERPGANWIQTQLWIKKVRFMAVEKGNSGKLGAFHWQVLSPHHLGQDSEDPNDGSITMLWQSSFVNVVTLADLGERGQMRLGEELDSWDNVELHENPRIVKVSHHGSADQFAELYEWLKPTIATVSVGKLNSYGHPTRATLKLLQSTSQLTLRTDQVGSISIASDGNHGLQFSSG